MLWHSLSSLTIASADRRVRDAWTFGESFSFRGFCMVGWTDGPLPPKIRCDRISQGCSPVLNATILPTTMVHVVAEPVVVVTDRANPADQEDDYVPIVSAEIV